MTPMAHQRPLRLPYSRERGSLLLVAMLMAAAIALVLGSYLKLSSNALKVAHRTFFARDANNLAEAGLEEAIYRLNLMAAGTVAATAWSGWTLTGTNATYTLPSFNRNQNAVGVVKVYVAGYNGSVTTPKVYSQAVVTPFDGSPPIIKTLQISLVGSSATTNLGLVVLNTAELADSCFADSFNSNPSNSPTGPWLSYSSSIATTDLAVGILAGTATFGPTAKITLSTNYSATYPLPTYPTTASVSQYYSVGSSLASTLPVSGHSPASDGRYYYFCSGRTIKDISITAGNHVTIVGSGGTKLEDGVTIPSSSSCYIYMDGTLQLDGSGFSNSSWAGALRIYTSTTSECKIDDINKTVACFYAPYAYLKIEKGGEFMGGLVVKKLKLSGGADYHYDKALLNPVSTSTPSRLGTFSFDSQWVSAGVDNFQGRFVIQNNSSAPITNWALSFTWTSNVTYFWESVFTSRSGNNYVFSNASWNGTIASGGTATFGVLGTATAPNIYPTVLNTPSGSSTNTLWTPSVSGTGASAAYSVTNSLELQSAADRATVASLTGNFLR
jgi:Cellulose binding domain